MIIKDKEHNGIIIPTAFEFGRCDITVTSAYGKDYTCVLFKNEQNEFIGQELKNETGMQTSSYMPDAVMFFDNPKSIDVVIHFLNDAKEKLIAIQKAEV